MNTPPALATGNALKCGAGDNLNLNVAPGSSTDFSGKHLFIVQAKPRDAAGNPLKSPIVSKDGSISNNYLFRLLNAETLVACTAEANITVTYVRTDVHAHSHPIFPATVTKNADGTFSSPLTFKKAGDWQINVHIVDGALEDDQAIAFTIPRS